MRDRGRYPAVIEERDARNRAALDGSGLPPEWSLRRHALASSTSGEWRLQTPHGPILLERDPLSLKWRIGGALFGTQAMLLRWEKKSLAGYYRYSRLLEGELGRKHSRDLGRAEAVLGWMRHAGLEKVQTKTRTELVEITREAARRYPAVVPKQEPLGGLLY